MIILHAGILGGDFLLWGERPLGPEASLKDRDTRKRVLKAASRLAEPYPYDAGVERLSAALQEAGFDFQEWETDETAPTDFPRMAAILKPPDYLGRKINSKPAKCKLDFLFSGNENIYIQVFSRRQFENHGCLKLFG